MGGASQQMQGATDITNANNAWMGAVGGLLGGVAKGGIPSIGSSNPFAPAGTVPGVGTFIDT